MTASDDKSPHESRRERLGDALRANLRRRKAQSKARALTGSAEPPENRDPPDPGPETPQEPAPAKPGKG